MTKLFQNAACLFNLWLSDGLHVILHDVFIPTVTPEINACICARVRPGPSLKIPAVNQPVLVTAKMWLFLYGEAAGWTVFHYRPVSPFGRVDVQ